MKIAVFLGSSTTCLPEFNEVAYDLGKAIALAGHTLVYGGSNIGTMKSLADGAAANGGRIVGVFPKGFLGTIEVQKEGLDVQRHDLDEMYITDSFAERKQLMEDLCDCAIVLPGSYGTLDELFTFACNHVIGKNNKRVFLLNHKGFYNPLVELMENIRKGGFLKPSAEGIIVSCDSIPQLMSEIDSL